MIEEWRDIDGYDGKYQVSNFGQVRSFKYKTPRILRAGLMQGYLGVQLCKNGTIKTCKVHRLAAQAFIPNPDNKPQVNHIDGDKTNNRVDNLEWCTGAENATHALVTGLQKSGAKLYNAKFTDEQASEILKLYVKGSREFGSVALSKKYGVSHNSILRLIHGQSYKNVVGDRRVAAVRKPVKSLTPAERAEIRRLYVKGSPEFGTVALGKKYGVDNKTIWQVVRR